MFSKDLYCNDCGHIGKTKRNMPGSILIELILWLFFIIPGLLYSIWRHSASKQGCGLCKSTNLIPSNSPKAIEAIHKQAK